MLMFLHIDGSIFVILPRILLIYEMYMFIRTIY